MIYSLLPSKEFNKQDECHILNSASLLQSKKYGHTLLLVYGNKSNRLISFYIDIYLVTEGKYIPCWIVIFLSCVMFFLDIFLWRASDRWNKIIWHLSSASFQVYFLLINQTFDVKRKSCMYIIDPSLFINVHSCVLCFNWIYVCSKFWFSLTCNICYFVWHLVFHSIYIFLRRVTTNKLKFLIIFLENIVQLKSVT